MRIQIQGWGTALPAGLISQEDATTVARELWSDKLARAKAIPALFRRTGVRQRHSVLLSPCNDGARAQQSFYKPAVDSQDKGPTTAQRHRVFEEKATYLALEACRGAISEAQIVPQEIDHLVTVCCTGFSAPGVDIGLAESLPLSREVTRTNIGFMGCHGALNGLRVARALAAQSPRARVLLCCVELCSLHQQYTDDPEQLVANALFSDGAAAVVIGAGAAADKSWLIAAQRSCVLPNTRQLMSWRVGDHGFEMSLSPEVPAMIQATLRPWLAHWLAEQNNLAIEDIRAWGIHPGGPRILTATADGLQIERSYLQPSQDVLAEYGNMSSPTILFILERLRRIASSRPCVALAFGPGLTIEAALFT